MGVMPDHWIERMARDRSMISPFARGRLRKGKISFGAASYGYDFRLSDEFKIPDFSSTDLIDPKGMDSLKFLDYRGRRCVIPPNSFVLGRSLEYFRVPRDVLALCQGKSTYARCGLVVNVTPFEPEWEGFVTVSLINTAPLPLRVHAGEGIGQVVFLLAESGCRISYADKKGKYQAQRSVQPARV
ncbi:MAG: dCTP deaminase [Acidobacteria bacterium]|nr:dCTP deaminase [Acidobacteriota bacterium]